MTTSVPGATAPSPDPARPDRSWWPTRWGLWSLPRAAWAFVLAVDLLAVVALVLTWPATRPTGPDLQLLGALVLCALVSVEGSRHLGSPEARRDRPYKDMLSAWMLPCALLLPPFYALLIPVPVYLLVQLRVTRLPTVKRVFNGACAGLAGCTASLLHTALAGRTRTGDVQALLGSGRGIGAVLLSAAAYSAVSALLVAGVLRRVNRTMSALGGARALAAAADGGRGDLPGRARGAGRRRPPGPGAARAAVDAAAAAHAAARRDARGGPDRRQDRARQPAALAARGGAGGGPGQARARAALAVLLVDLDRFKSVNDRYGHLAGDQVLAAVAQELRAAVRPRDAVGRFGGEEFVLLLTDASCEDAVATAERVRARVARLEHPVGRGQAPLRTTVSVGVALYGGPAQDLTGLLAAADGAMYAAKAAGRDCVRVAGAPLAGAVPVPS